MYYAFTTLSKVGLGDFYPVTDAERLLCSLIFTGCIAVFSVIVDELGNSMHNLSALYGDIDGKEGLEQFFDVIKVFNNGQQLNKEIQNNIIDFLDKKNINDKNGFLQTDQDRMLLAQLPDVCVIEIYRNFLYKGFLLKFTRMFNFSWKSVGFFGFLQPKNDGTITVATRIYSKKNMEKIKYGDIPFPYYTFEDEIYSSFMIKLLNALEFRKYESNDIIAQEMDEAHEILFVEHGTYDIGYEINKKVFYRRRFGPGTTIGGFQVCYRRRFAFVYKAQASVSGLAVRKETFMTITKEFQQIYIQLKHKFWYHYSQAIFQPLMKLKNVEILDYNYRNDYG